MGCCLSTRKRRPRSKSEISSTSTHDQPVPSISDPSLSCAGHEQGKEETSESAGEKQHVCSTLDSASDTVDSEEMVQTPHVPSSSPPGISDPSPECVEQEQGKESSGPANQTHHAPPSSGSAPHTDDNEEIVITNIRATDVTLGLRRIPAGFCTIVNHSDLAWRTENKPSLANDDALEWSVLIPVPSDLSATVCLEIYASFERQPVLGAGEQLRRLTVTVEQLLDRSAEDAPFTFFPKDGDVVSPCSSILVTIERRKCEHRDSSLSTVLGPYCSTESQDELEDATDQAHSALSRYRKYRDKRDLERSVRGFERALSICSLDHPCRAAAQSNLAMTRFILYRVEGTYGSLEVIVNLYRSALTARPVGHIDRPATLIQLAAVHFAQFEKSEDDVERARAEALLHETMDLSSAENHENRAAMFMLQLAAGRRVSRLGPDGQSSVDQGSSSSLTDEDLRILSVGLLHRFERFGDLADLEQAIAVLKELIRFTPVWDDRYIAGLGSLASALLDRFKHLGNLIDLDDAISMLKDAIDLTPHGHPIMSALLNNLGVSFKIRFECLGRRNDLEDSITTLRDAVDRTPHGHLARPDHLNNLGNSFLARFQHFGELNDLEDAISRQRNAVELTPQGHPHKPCSLNNLGNTFFARFERLGELSDLEDAISRYRDAVELTPHDHPEKPGRLNNLGTTLGARFELLGELSDIEDSISMLRSAVRLTPRSHHQKHCFLDNLGVSFHTRFERLGELSDIEDAISTLKDAIELTPYDHPDKLTRLNNLGNSFKSRFDRLSDPHDLDDAIWILRDAVDSAPHDHPRRPDCLSNLGNSLMARFKRFGKLSDLEDAISSQRDAVNLTPHGHPSEPGLLNHLGNSCKTHFEHLGWPSDLEDAIAMLRGAVELTSPGHPDKSARLIDLGNALRARFERLGEPSDIEDAISRYRDAVNLTPLGHLDRAACLNNFGTSLDTRFSRLGELSDIEDAISMLKDAVELTPNDHPHKPSYLNNLGISFRTRFERLGELSDIEGAISMLRNAVELTPHGHPDKPARLNNLSLAFKNRFDRLRELSDLEDSISMLRDVVHLTPYSHLDMPDYLNNLSTSLTARFQRLGDLRDLDDAILKQRDAIGLTPVGHPRLPACLGNLGNHFSIRFRRLGESRDIEDAISLLMDAVDLTPHGHPDKPDRLSSLSISFKTRFESLGELSDLENALVRQIHAIELTPYGHPHKPAHLKHLGDSFVTRFRLLGELSDLENAISQYFHAASAPSGLIETRLHASREWISCARQINHRSLLHAYSVAVNLLPQLAWIGLSLIDRYALIMLHADVVREAAAAALDSGHLETAVEWLEQGRSIIWGQQLRLRSSSEALLSAHPDHAHRLQQLSVELEHAGVTREKSRSDLEQTQSSAHRATESLQQTAYRHRMLAIERDKLLQEIRRFRGFERFLLHKEFSQLRASAHSGPVVILNSAESRCDALVVLPNVDHVIHVPLPKFTFKRSEGLQNMLEKLLGHARVAGCDDREGERATRGCVSWESLLSTLWSGIVKPILDALALSIPGDLSRIFWCPTGPFAFLPIHAAGFYDAQHSQPGHKVSDFVISSYTPTLSILALSPNPTVAPSDHLRLLAVRQPPSDGQRPLSGVAVELKYIREIVKNSSSVCTTLVEPSIGTVEEVLSLMKEADWVHFACHGVQDFSDSGLCLADGRRLKLLDITTLPRPPGGLAFLSACQTAMGEEYLSDEAIHLAAGMLFAGYGGVIGTMWSISDRLAPVVARDVYGQLFRNGTPPDYREAARALHGAIERLRESGNASFTTWLPFIHVGL